MGWAIRCATHGCDLRESIADDESVPDPPPCCPRCNSPREIVETVPCEECDGTGKEPCDECGGGGATEWDEEDSLGSPDDFAGTSGPCPGCRGKGTTECAACGGLGCFDADHE